ncbi:1,2-phenylacetyl-CoA epoxidase subunit PaaE [Halobaculum marinum]|uniref:1,2-phenylacetyl-CoA epoxidase subunit PaaE n=1 Tax=Halobaculum marinum TaxID=3031996 RepID=A0ABD5WWF2_9EURY|nr:1,2-phenylacetyl-CoA epoxidase subunit PaaE [Halobaculum sp. DT55]
MRRHVPDPSVAAGAAGSDDDDPAECPYCGSTDTEREHPKGPGLCRSMHFCNDCSEPFQRFG